MVTPSNIRNITPYITLEWLHQHQIAVFSLTTTQPDQIDIFALAVTETLNTWKPGQPILVLYDLRKVAQNGYFRQRASEVTRNTPDRPGRAAMLVDDFLLARLLQMLLPRLIQPKTHLKRQLFFTKAEALAWLEEALTTDR